MDTGSKQASSNGRPPPPTTGQWKPGQSGNPHGRRRKTPEYRELERLTKQQVTEALERLVGPAIERALKIVQKGGEPEAVRVFLALLDRTVGAVPSAQYIAAQISNSPTVPEAIDADTVTQALANWVMARKLQAPQGDVIENGDAR